MIAPEGPQTEMSPDCLDHRVQGEGMEYLPGESGAPGAPASPQTSKRGRGQEEPSKLWRQKFHNLKQSKITIYHNQSNFHPL